MDIVASRITLNITSLDNVYRCCVSKATVGEQSGSKLPRLLTQHEPTMLVPPPPYQLPQQQPDLNHLQRYFRCFLSADSYKYDLWMYLPDPTDAKSDILDSNFDPASPQH